MFKKIFIVLLVFGTLLRATVPTEESVTRLYIATFDRAPDKTGLEYWLHQSGLHIEEIAKSFFDQPETQAKYPAGFSETDFIEAIYTNLFKRDADSTGFDYWLADLESGKVDKSVFILAIINGAQGDDAKILANKTKVGLAFERAGKSDVEEARLIMVNITASTDTLEEVLCEYSLAGCSETQEGVNHAPTALAQSKTVKEDSTDNTITLTGKDIDSADTLTFKVKTQPSHGTLTGTAPNLKYTPTADYNGTDSFTFTVNDATVDSASATVTITVTDVAEINSIPVATSQSITVVEDSSNNTITLAGTDADDDTLTYTIETEPSHGTLIGTEPNMKYTPTADYNATDSFTFTVNDGTVDSASATVTITVTDVAEPNTTPVATPQSVTIVEDSVDNAITLEGTDADDDTLTYTIKTEPTHGTLSATGANIIYTPTADYYGGDSFTFTVNDETVDSSSAMVTLTVTNVNDTPTITSTAPTTATEDIEYTYTPSITDTENNTITWTLSDKPTDMSINSSTGKVLWTPLEGVSTSEEVNITATDNGSPTQSVSELFTITVTAVNDAPVITTTAPITATEDIEYTYTPTATDAESDTITWTISGQPATMTINSSSGEIAWTPLEGVTSSGAVTITATDDGEGTLSDTETFTIVVTQVNDKPIADSGDDQSDVEMGSVVTLDGSGSSDEDGDTLTYSWTIDTKPTDSTATLSSSTVESPTFTADKVGTYTLSLVANDSTIDSESDSVTIEVVDTTSPTLAITDDTSEVLGVLLVDRAWQEDNVTFTFEFSESVTGFIADDITVTNGDKGTFSGEDGDMLYTLLVTPTTDINGKDSITVTVNAGVTTDEEGNANESNSTTQEVDLEAPFITVWKTSNDGVSDSDKIMIKTNGSYSYNYTIDWGDGETDEGVTEDITHTYSSSGEYTIKITGDFPHFLMEWVDNGTYTTDNDKLLQVTQWGTQEWQSMATSFINCSNLDGDIVDDPNLDNVTDMVAMFDGASAFNQALDSWDVSSVENMRSMFSEASSFNQDLDSWDVSSITDMSYMFYKASSFNQNLTWGDKTSKVTDMSYMFYGASSFDKPLDSWDVSKVTDMTSMFDRASSFDQPLDSWTVSNVTNMSVMFYEASSFNQDLNSWDVSSVEDMHHMFSGATIFDGDITSWTVTKVTDMSSMFSGASAFDQDISGWDVSSVTNMSGMFNGASSFNQNLTWGNNTLNVTDMSYMFGGATIFNRDISGWSVDNVTNMNYMFNGTDSFNQSLNWDVSSVTNMSGMFSGATAFNQPLNWNVSSVENMSEMFYGASAFIGQDLSGWTVTNVTDHTDFMTGAGTGNTLPTAWQ